MYSLHAQSTLCLWRGWRRPPFQTLPGGLRCQILGGTEPGVLTLSGALTFFILFWTANGSLQLKGEKKWFQKDLEMFKEDAGRRDPAESLPLVRKGERTQRMLYPFLWACPQLEAF